MRAAKLHVGSGAVLGLRIADALPALPEGLAYLDLADTDICDGALHWFDGTALAARTPVQLVASVSAVEASIAGIPNNAWYMLDDIVIQHGAGPLVVTVTQAATVQLIGRWFGSVEIEPLSAAKLRQRINARLVREQRAAAGCMTPKGRVDTDEQSRAKVNAASTGAVIAVMFDQPFSINWTMSDNSVEAHDAQEMMALGKAVLAHVYGCQRACTAIQNQIEAAEDAATLAAINLLAGYPPPDA